MSFLSWIAMAMAPSGQGGQGAGGSGSMFETLLLIVPMIVIFYFFLIRPQSKRAKVHSAFLEGIKRGDKVITTGGLWGKVAQVADKTVDLEVANNVKVRVTKGAIAGYQAGDPAAGES